MHKVHLIKGEEIVTHLFDNAMEAVRFYYLSQINPLEPSIIELVPSEFEHFDFMPPKVTYFSGTFVNEYFVGKCTLEAADGTCEHFEGVISVHEVDFGKYATTHHNNTCKQAILNLQLAGGKKVGRNDDTCQTFLLLGDNMIAVDDTGQIKVSSKMSTWNTAIEEIIYEYENPYYDNDEENFHI
jgi:hypothetical protein